MRTTPSAGHPKRRSWSAYLGAFGRAHRRARTQLDGAMPLLQHLEELRRRAFKAFAALVVATLFSFLFAERLLNLLAAPIGGIKALVSIEITENVAVFMRVSLLSGVVLAMPVIVYQALCFVFPALTQRERRWLLLSVPTASLLFVAGVGFTWSVMLPAAVPFLTNFLGIATQVRPHNYVGFATSLMFWIGVSFEMPMVVMFLARLKLITAAQLLHYWRQAVVAMAIAAAVITPTVDPVNMGLVMLPLAGLYVISMGLAAVAGRS
jgi:sec-independent protein translocase protein TatC